MVIEDAATDPRFKDNRLVTGEPHIRFYAGAVIRGRNGEAVGSLCLIDYKPRAFTAHERALLGRLRDLIRKELMRYRESQDEHGDMVQQALTDQITSLASPDA